jgi:hypothetical protein
MLQVLPRYQIHRTAPKPSSHHASAGNTILFTSNINQNIEFTTTNFVIIPKRVVRIVDHFTQLLNISLLQRLSCGQRSHILRNYMTTPAMQCFSQLPGEQFKLMQIQIAQGLNRRILFA